MSHMHICFNFHDKGEDHSSRKNPRLKSKNHKKIKIKKVSQKNAVNFFQSPIKREIVIFLKNKLVTQNESQRTNAVVS